MILKELKEKYKDKEIIYADLSSGFKLGTMSINNLEGNSEDNIEILKKGRILKSRTVYKLGDIEFVIGKYNATTQINAHNMRPKVVQFKCVISDTIIPIPIYTVNISNELKSRCSKSMKL